MPLHSTPTLVEADPNLEVSAPPHHQPPTPTTALHTDTPPLTTTRTANAAAVSPKSSATINASKKRPPPTTLRIASCPGGSLSGAFGTRLTPILPHNLGTIASAIGAPPPHHTTTPSTVPERLLLLGRGTDTQKGRGVLSPPPPLGTHPAINTNNATRSTAGINSSIGGGGGDVPLRTVAPTVAEPLQVRLVAAMRRTGITWEVLAGEYQRAVSGYTRLSSETLQRWAVPKGDAVVVVQRQGVDVVVGDTDRGACESLATAFIEDSASLTQLVADHFHQHQQEQQHDNNGSSLSATTGVDFAAFCRASHLPLGDAAAWIDGGTRGGGMGRIARSIGPQALSLLTHSAIQRQQALQRDSHEHRKYQELQRRKHDHSKVVASPERIREGGGGGDSSSPRDLLFTDDGGANTQKATASTNTTTNKRKALQFHSVAAGANAAPKAYKAIAHYRSRFGRSDTTPLSGLGDDDGGVVVVSVGDDRSGGMGVGSGPTTVSAINNSSMTISSDMGSSAIIPTPTHHTTSTALTVVPRWKKMADARPPIPIRPDSSTLLQNKKRGYHHPVVPISFSKDAITDGTTATSNNKNSSSNHNHSGHPVRITQDSRPEWYKDRQELEAVMRRRILSSERNVRNDVVVDAFFEPQGGNRAVVRDGGFPVVGLVAENIVNVRREKQRAAMYRKELGDDW